MHAAAERSDFMPPPESGLMRSIAFAVVAHLLLVMALSLSLHWKRDDNAITVEAELWSPTVQQAAPKLVETPPPPPPPPVQEKPVPPPPPPTRSDAEIALEREKQRLAQDKLRQEEQEREKAAERKRAEEARKQELARKAAEEERKKREEQAKAKAREKQEAERLAKQRQENINRAQGLAGATGAPSATGTALRSSGPSDSYAGRIRARVKPNIVFTDDLPGNPSAEVEVRMAPDGTIIGKRIAKASGSKSWDDAVLRALDRTEVLPRDIDGRVHTPIVLVFRPKDL